MPIFPIICLAKQYFSTTQPCDLNHHPGTPFYDPWHHMPLRRVFTTPAFLLLKLAEISSPAFLVITPNVCCFQWGTFSSPRGFHLRQACASAAQALFPSSHSPFLSTTLAGSAPTEPTRPFLPWPRAFFSPFHQVWPSWRPRSFPRPGGGLRFHQARGPLDRAWALLAAL